MTSSFKKLYKLAESMGSSNDEQYMPQPFGQDPEHQSTMDPVNPEPLGITQPKEDGNQFISSVKTAGDLKSHLEKDHEQPTSHFYHRAKGYFGDDHEAFHSMLHNDNLENYEDGHLHPQGGAESHSIIIRGVEDREASKKTADMSNTDENPSPGNVSAPKSVYRVNVEDEPEQQLFGDAGETSRGDNSIIMSSLTVNPESRKIVHAYIAENGTPQCSVCENYYTPKSIADAKLAHCGHCPEDNPDANKISEGDVVDGNVIKTAPREAAAETPHSCPGCGEKTSKTWVNGSCNTCGYKPKSASKKLSNDSELYTRGFLDHQHGKPLDEDLAVLSDDYFNGYDQARYYGKTPLESVGAKPHKVTIPHSLDNSLEGWAESGIGGSDYEYTVDRSQIIASTLPTNVLEEFFNTKE